MTRDQIVNNVIDKIKSRSEAGMRRFGISMSDRDDKSVVEWLRDAQEEAMDFVCYLEKAIQDMENPTNITKLKVKK